MLESVFSQRCAGLAVEIIVVDDCSTDQTQSVLATFVDKLRLHVLTTNRGAGVARNEGLKLATGTYVKFLDSDDLLYEGALVDEVRMAEDAAADMLISGWWRVQIDDSLVTIPGTERLSVPPDMVPLPDTLLMGRAAPISAVLYRRQYIDGLWWNPQIRCPDDWHYFCQAALRYGKIVNRTAPAFWWRDHVGPRASVADPLTFAKGHHLVLRLIEETLAAQNLLTKDRKELLAQYYYKQLYILATHDTQGFNRAAAHILDLDPTFQPTTHEPKRYMRAHGACGWVFAEPFGSTSLQSSGWASENTQTSNRRRRLSDACHHGSDWLRLSEQSPLRTGYICDPAAPTTLSLWSAP